MTIAVLNLTFRALLSPSRARPNIGPMFSLVAFVAVCGFFLFHKLDIWPLPVPIVRLVSETTTLLFFVELGESRVLSRRLRDPFLRPATSGCCSRAPVPAPSFV